VSVSRTEMVTLRPATATDCRQVWLWRNDAETRRASFDPSPIDYATHQSWFLGSLDSARRKIYIVVARGEPAGVVRLDIAERQATVSIYLAPERRGQGIGPAALLALADLASGELGLAVLLASVKPDNYASLAAFRRAGFTASRTGPTVTLARDLREGRR
jgi:RimJ/RimL family protein N-acetyltransferase